MVNALSNRPRLKSHVQLLRRGTGSLQLGLCPDVGVVLEGLSDAEIALAEGLDGTRTIHTVYAVAASAGVNADRVAALIEILNEHHLLVDPSDRCDQAATRSRQHVVVSGDGDLPCALADLLRVGGIGTVSVGANAVNTLDLELRAHGAANSRSATANSRSATATPDPALDISALPDLVVLAAMGAVRADAGAPWLRRGIPHLPLVVQAHRVQVGPLIAAGTVAPGPCLACMDLHRRDRDPAWPALLSQLSPTWPLRLGAAVTLESTLTAMAIGVAAMIVHACLDGQPVPNDLSLELSLPWPNILTRRWFRHPMCECTRKHATMAQ
jgi:hypothetical protein